MKILLDWEFKELDRGARGSLSRAKYEIDIDTEEIEFLEENKLNFKEILKLANKVKEIKDKNYLD